LLYFFNRILTRHKNSKCYKAPGGPKEGKPSPTINKVVGSSLNRRGRLQSIAATEDRRDREYPGSTRSSV
jgi:hypothetical protein